MTTLQLAMRMVWLTTYSASLWLLFAWSHVAYTVGHGCDGTAHFEQLGSKFTAVLAFLAAVVAAAAFTRHRTAPDRRAVLLLIALWPFLALERALLDYRLNARCLYVKDAEPTAELTQSAATILLLSGPLVVAVLCGLGLWRRRRHARTYVQIPSPGDDLHAMKPTASVVVSSAVPQPVACLPTARVLAPAIARPDRLTGDRLAIFQVLLGALVVMGVLGVIASFVPGYEIRADADNSLLRTRPAGSGSTVFWCVAGAALAVFGIARPSRATARAIGWLFILLIFVGFFAVLSIDGLINLDDFSFSTHIERTGAVAMLQFAIGAMVFAGPIILLTQWRLFRR